MPARATSARSLRRCASRPRTTAQTAPDTTEKRAAVDPASPSSVSVPAPRSRPAAYARPLPTPVASTGARPATAAQVTAALCRPRRWAPTAAAARTSGAGSGETAATPTARTTTEAAADQASTTEELATLSDPRARTPSRPSLRTRLRHPTWARTQRPATSIGRRKAPRWNRTSPVAGRVRRSARPPTRKPAVSAPTRASFAASGNVSHRTAMNTAAAATRRKAPVAATQVAPARRPSGWPPGGAGGGAGAWAAVRNMPSPSAPGAPAATGRIPQRPLGGPVGSSATRCRARRRSG